MQSSMILRLCAIVVLVASPLQARATFILYSDRGAFDAAAPGLPVETFENNSNADGAVIAITPPLNSSTNNGGFTPGDILPGISVTTNNGVLVVLTAGGFTPTDAVAADLFGSNTILDFSPGVDAVGLDVYIVSGSVNVNFFGAGGLLGTVPVMPGALPNSQFVGAISSEPITQVTLTGGFGEIIDNVAFGNVPEPTSIVLFGMTFAGAAGVRWLRRRRV